MSRGGGTGPRFGHVVVLLAAGLALAACNSTGAVVAVTGHPSISIEVPLSMAACTASNSCVALGTSSLGPKPMATAEYRRADGTWTRLRTPAVATAALVASSCWRDGCLIGGTSASGDLVWRYRADGPALTALAGPPQGEAVNAISCFAARECAVVDSTGPLQDSRFLYTTDGGAAWSTPSSIPGTSDVRVTALACVDALHCLLAAQSDTNALIQNSPLLEATNDGGIKWRNAPAPAGAARLADLSCAARHCDALVATRRGVQWARSSGLGRDWTVQRTPGSATALACTRSGRCVVAGATVRGPWLATTHGASLAPGSLRFVPSPFTAAACGATLCALSAPSTVASVSP